jgi:hypothetical protein
MYRNHLVPEAWQTGFMYTAATSLSRPTFLCGKTDVVGWWYYFPLAMLFKTPLATLIALLLALSLIVRRLLIERRTTNWEKLLWPVAAGMIAPIIYLAVAMHGKLNLGIRHVLPVFPFLFVLLGVVIARALPRRPYPIGWILAALFIGLAAETYNAYPDYIPFFNVASGGARGGLKLLSDSNIDWGQELPDLANWQANHKDRQLYLSYFGSADPSYYGIHFVAMEGSSGYPGNEEPDGRPHTFAISAVSLQGQYLRADQQKLYEPFRGKRPDIVLDGSLYLFNQP